MPRISLPALAGLLSLLVVTPALAQTAAFPSRPITILVPFAPGGSSDTILRPIAAKAAEALHATIVIDNRPGGGGNVAALATKQAAPDGHTLFLANNGTFAINPALFADLRFDPVKDFQPITELVSFPSVLVVPAASPARNVEELAALAKATPAGLSFASQGVGSGGHILGEMFHLKAGGTMAHVPYRGAGPAVTDVLAGRIDFLFTSYISVSEQAKAGQLRILAWTAPKRSATIPDVPTMAEAGFPGTELEIWHGIVAPAGTPPAIVAKLHDAFVAAAHDPDIVRLVAPQGADIVGGTPEAFGHLIAADLDRLGKIVRDAGIKMQ